MATLTTQNVAGPVPVVVGEPIKIPIGNGFKHVQDKMKEIIDEHVKEQVTNNYGDESEAEDEARVFAEKEAAHCVARDAVCTMHHHAASFGPISFPNALQLYITLYQNVTL